MNHILIISFDYHLIVSETFFFLAIYLKHAVAPAHYST